MLEMGDMLQRVTLL